MRPGGVGRAGENGCPFVALSSPEIWPAPLTSPAGVVRPRSRTTGAALEGGRDGAATRAASLAPESFTAAGRAGHRGAGERGAGERARRRAERLRRAGLGRPCGQGRRLVEL